MNINVNQWEMNYWDKSVTTFTDQAVKIATDLS